MPRKSSRRVPKSHSPVPVLKERPKKRQGPLTIETVELLVRWLLETHRYTPWFDTEAASSYLRREPSTLKSWRSRGEGPRFYLVNDKFVRYHLDDLDAYVRGGRRSIPKWMRERVIESAEGDASAVSSPPHDTDEK